MLPEYTRAVAGAYVRGLFDGEGSVSLKGRRLRTIRIANTEPSIVEHALACLRLLTIDAACYWSSTANLKHPGSKPIANIAILGRRNILLFCRYVGSASHAKAARLKALRASYKPGGRYRRYRYLRRESPTFIAQVSRLYADGATLSEVAKRMGCETRTISTVLRAAGVAIRAYTPQERGRMSVEARRRKKQLLALPLDGLAGEIP